MPTATLETAAIHAARLGLEMTTTPGEFAGGERIRVFVERPEERGGWSLAPTLIAHGSDPSVVAQAAMDSLREMGQRLQKKLDELDPAHEAVLPAYGVGADGTITALRVERDGSVRLSDADIERIANAVVREEDNYAALMSAVKELRAMLNHVQWVEAEDGPGSVGLMCPFCHGWQPKHESGCELAALIAG